jgi:N-acetylmuramoyl-L-alanine amidase
MRRIAEHPSPNHGPRTADSEVDMLVLHYTGMASADAALARLCDPIAEVSAHYLIEEDGTVLRLVDESRRAWHAGVSFWRGHRDVNSRSIGIELVNPGHEFGYRDFPEPQMAALIELAAAIVARHPIPARNVIGHSDIAPDRKTDPGERFDWHRLAEAGIGLWPRESDTAADTDIAAIPDMLVRFGYDPQAEQALAAFQRHFRPDRIDNAPDAECARLLAGLLQQV